MSNTSSCARNHSHAAASPGLLFRLWRRSVRRQEPLREFSERRRAPDFLLRQWQLHDVKVLQSHSQFAFEALQNVSGGLQHSVTGSFD